MWARRRLHKSDCAARVCLVVQVAQQPCSLESLQERQDCCSSVLATLVKACACAGASPHPHLLVRLPRSLMPQTDRKTPLGELNWIFTAITDTIAWNMLPRALFQKLFRSV
jgi:hypothetical protein